MFFKYIEKYVFKHPRFLNIVRNRSKPSWTISKERFINSPLPLQTVLNYKVIFPGLVSD